MIQQFGSAAFVFALLAPATARTVAKVTVEIDINEGVVNSGNNDLLSDPTQSILVAAGPNENRQHPIQIEIEEEVDAGNNVTAALADVPASVTCPCTFLRCCLGKSNTSQLEPLYRKPLSTKRF